MANDDQSHRDPVAQSQPWLASAEKQRNDQPLLLQLGSPHFSPCYWRGMRQPVVLVGLSVKKTEIDAASVHRFDDIQSEVCPWQEPDSSSVLIEASVSNHPLLGRLVRLTLGILDRMGMPVAGGVKAIKSDLQNEQLWTVGLPATCRENRAPQAAFGLACALMNQVAEGSIVRASLVEVEITKLMRQFARYAPQGINTLRFLQAAHELEIPWRHVANNVYQFGWGSNARWLDSSFTDQTSVISANLARDKVACAKVLRSAGLPVPTHHLVSNAEQAVTAANTLGYPVVVKPANLDGGRGVFAGLSSPEAVQRAYGDAAKLSKQILVEQFIAGNDYRLQVFKGEVFWVVHRRPACVRGNGVNTVNELVACTNMQRRQTVTKVAVDPMTEQGGKPIALDEEALEWLGKQGLSPASVPANGQIVRLRGAANVGLGGTREGVALDQVHPDNIKLVSKAASLLKLDLAGIDLLIPDIARSWRESGGGICEVNGQPQLAAHLHRQLLPKLLQGHGDGHRYGRVPVVCICLSSALWSQHTVVQHTLAAAGIRVAWVNSYEACWQALADSEVDAVIWQLEDSLPHLTPMPVDVVDVFVLAHNRTDDPASNPAANEQIAALQRSATQVWTITDAQQHTGDLALSNLSRQIIRHLMGAVPANKGARHETEGS